MYSPWFLLAFGERVKDDVGVKQTIKRRYVVFLSVFAAAKLYMLVQKCNLDDWNN